MGKDDGKRAPGPPVAAAGAELSQRDTTGTGDIQGHTRECPGTFMGSPLSQNLLNPPWVTPAQIHGLGTKRDETGPPERPAASRCEFPKKRRQKLGPGGSKGTAGPPREQPGSPHLPFPGLCARRVWVTALGLRNSSPIQHK